MPLIVRSRIITYHFFEALGLFRLPLLECIPGRLVVEALLRDRVMIEVDEAREGGR
jgi:hypothetical protein